MQYRMLKDLHALAARMRRLRGLRHGDSLFVGGCTMNKAPAKHECQTQRHRRVRDDVRQDKDIIGNAQQTRGKTSSSGRGRQLCVPPSFMRANNNAQKSKAIAMDKCLKPRSSALCRRRSDSRPKQQRISVIHESRDIHAVTLVHRLKELNL